MAITAPTAFWNFDESSGNAVDASGNGLTLTNSNVTYTTGLIGNGAVFENTTSEYFTRADEALVSPTGDLTFSLWFKATTNVEAGFISKWGASGSNFDFYFGKSNDAGGRIHFNYTADGITTNGSQGFWAYTATTGVWTHYAVTFDASAHAQELFINGSSQGVVTSNNDTSIHDGTGALYVGKNENNTNSQSGQMDMVGFWNGTVLSSAEISELYNAGAGIQYPFTAAASGGTGRLMMMGMGR